MQDNIETKEKTVGASNVNDGWGNALSGFKNPAANKANVSYEGCNEYTYSDMELDNMFAHDGFSRRVITCMAEDMVNKGFTVAGDTANILMNEADRLNWTGVFFDAICQSRLHGGSAIYMGIDDGRKPDKPIAVNSIRGCRFLRVIPKSRIMWNNDSVERNPTSEHYGFPEYYTVSDPISQKEYTIHRDRLIILPWISSSPIKSPIESVTIWGTPVLNYTAKQIGNLAVFHDSLSNMSQEAVVGKYKIANLAQMLANNEENALLTRMDIIQECKSVINAVMLDADNNEDYTRDSLSFAGMNGVADTMMVLLSCVAEIPVTRLFGRSPSGLDASGESDLKIYYDMVSSYQKSMLMSALKRLMFYIDKYMGVIEIEDKRSMRSTMRNGKNVGRARKSRPITEGDISIQFTPLYQMTEKERADVYKSNADADRIYLDAGIITKEEIRVNRFLGGYNQYISVETADIPVEAEEENRTEKPVETEADPDKETTEQA